MKKPAKKPTHPKIEYTKITGQVYIGTNACCAAHFSAALLRKGITADISLEEENLDHPRGVETYLWLPTKDHTAPKMDPVRAGIEALDELLRRGKKVYIHCKNGHGRSPTFFAAYLIAKKGMGVKEAANFVSERRPRVHIEDSQWDLLDRIAAETGFAGINGGLIP